MTNMRRRDLFDDAHGEIPVLASLVSDPEPANLSDACSTIYPQVTHEVLPQKQIRVPVRLKIGIRTPPLRVDFVLVAVDDLGLRVGVEFNRDQEQGMLRQFVIVVEERNELSFGHGERAVGCR